jgi:dihydrodipicolinate synthase/N-acetylneuraminate lyase
MSLPVLSHPLKGIIPPMVTPLRGRDELDLPGLKRLVEHLVSGGVSGLFLLGTTGEGPSLSYRLRYELVEHTCELVAGRVPVLVGVTDTSLVEALELAKFSRDAGASAVVAAAPYYFPVEQPALLTFFLGLADESPLPLFLYNMPSCVKVSLAFETLEELSRHENVVGLKDSSGDMAYFRQALTLKQARPDWTILMGPEHLTAEAVLAGGDGGVTGGANLDPRLFVEFYAAATRRDQPSIDRLQSEVAALGRIYTVGGNGMSAYLCGLKCALELAGLCSGHLVEPFTSFGMRERREVEALLTEMSLIAAIVLA